MDHYADDLAAVVQHLDLHDAIHVGHSTGGGELTRYLARHGLDRAAKAVLISSVPPLMVQTEANPGGLPKSVFDDLQAAVGGQPLGVLPRPAVRSVLRLQPGTRTTYPQPYPRGDHRQLVAPGHDGRRQGPLRRHRGVLRRPTSPRTSRRSPVPSLVMHGDDDQIVPYADAGVLSAKLAARTRRSRSTRGFPHGMPTTQVAHHQPRSAGVRAFLKPVGAEGCSGRQRNCRRPCTAS